MNEWTLQQYERTSKIPTLLEKKMNTASDHVETRAHAVVVANHVCAMGLATHFVCAMGVANHVENTSTCKKVRTRAQQQPQTVLVSALQ